MLSRKSQLEELYVDNQELERKRREVEFSFVFKIYFHKYICTLLNLNLKQDKIFAQVEAWLARMEGGVS